MPASTWPPTKKPSEKFMYEAVTPPKRAEHEDAEREQQRVVLPRCPLSRQPGPARDRIGTGACGDRQGGGGCAHGPMRAGRDGAILRSTASGGHVAHDVRVGIDRRAIGAIGQDRPPLSGLRASRRVVTVVHGRDAVHHFALQGATMNDTTTISTDILCGAKNPTMLALPQPLVRRLRRCVRRLRPAFPLRHRCHGRHDGRRFEDIESSWRATGTSAGPYSNGCEPGKRPAPHGRICPFTPYRVRKGGGAPPRQPVEAPLPVGRSSSLYSWLKSVSRS